VNDQNALATQSYPARRTIDRPDTLDRLTTLLPLLWIIPIGVIAALVSGDSTTSVTMSEKGEIVRTGGTSIVFSISAATALMLLFRQRYRAGGLISEDSAREFSYRVGAYGLLLATSTRRPRTSRRPSRARLSDAKLLSKVDALGQVALALPHWIILGFLF